MPLDFLKRKSGAGTDVVVQQQPPVSPLLPEEVTAQEHQLKLYYAGKSSEGVRMKAGPRALDE